MKATLKKINEHIATLTPHLELFKGYGYFYFGLTPDAPPEVCEPPESIGICHLNHMSLEDWKKHVEWEIKEWEKNEYESH